MYNTCGTAFQSTYLINTNYIKNHHRGKMSQEVINDDDIHCNHLSKPNHNELLNQKPTACSGKGQKPISLCACTLKKNVGWFYTYRTCHYQTCMSIKAECLLIDLLLRLHINSGKELGPTVHVGRIFYTCNITVRTKLNNSRQHTAVSRFALLQPPYIHCMYNIWMGGHEHVHVHTVCKS